ncbi:MAG: peptidoglycan DD-metalloendopeptidase family protein [Paludibacter sp.]|jgi:septal ring factor EnvC (AmiA/AmiB activator)|nr:peptidoglycan DD-metalloendopeptidase family protein [Paludibacter sp.]
MKKIIIILLLFMPLVVVAQTVKDLEQQRKQTLQELETTNQILSETKKTQQSSMTKLNVITKNINERKKLIRNISTEISTLNDEMNRLTRETGKLNSKLTDLKNDYARLVEETHRHNNLYDRMLFVLSADDFGKSFRRFRYLQQFTEYRKEQVGRIEQVKTQLAQKNDSLEQHKKTKTDVILQQQQEATKLTQDQQKEKTVYNDLNRKRKQLESDLKAQQKKAAQLNNKIEQLIAEEIRKAEEKNKKDNKSTTETSSGKASNSAESVLTKEQQLVSKNFADNRGRLPWPTEKGFVSGHYGVQPHPVLTHVTTDNKGVYIQTPAQSNARAVFEGVVTQRFSVPGSNNAIIVQHGEYRSVYANLTEIYVKVGDNIKAKQAIGKIYTDTDNDNKTELYFQVWKDKNLLNPESWLAK